MTPELPTLLVARRPRRLGVDWTGAPSWLGGAPRLGPAPWPRGDDGSPLHFVAQIDLRQVAMAAGPGVPSSGSLAFFIGRSGAVVFVPEGSAAAASLPPPDTPELTTYGGAPTWRRDQAGRRLFPYWPVDLFRLSVAPPGDESMGAFEARQATEVERFVERRRFPFSAREAFAGPAIPDWWRCAMQLASDLAAAESGAGGLRWWREQVEQRRSEGGASLTEALANVARLEGELETLHEANPAFRAYVAEVKAWVAGRDPWSLMAPRELERLRAYWQRNTEFPRFTGYHGIGELDRLKEKTFKALPGHGEPGFGALPEAVQALIRRKRAPRPQWWRSARHFSEALRILADDTRARGAEKDAASLAAYRAELARRRPGGLRGLFGRKPAPNAAGVAALQAQITAIETRIAGFRETVASLDAFARDTEAWVAGRSPLARMSAHDVEDFEARLARARTEFAAYTRYEMSTSIEDYENATLLAFATGSDEAYGELPEEVRTLINSHHLLPAGGAWHQMFGQGVEIQGGSGMMYDEGHVMLLQLRYDDLMAWSFGDLGAYQWWIQPRDLAAGNWSAVQMTFEAN